MSGKTARSAPRPPFGLPEVPVAVGTSRLSSREAGKAVIFTPVRESSSGESRARSSASAGKRRFAVDQSPMALVAKAEKVTIGIQTIREISV
jgi:hypothetical protein